ncbi:MAG: MFS transporter [Actinomycetota bacterium]|nr:MFS transporter [Actinomycetota bacterium]
MSTGGHVDNGGRAAGADLASGPFSPAYRLITVAVVALITIVAFEFMAIATAMPAAAEELDAVTSYGLAFSVMLTGQLLGIVLAGVWSDRSGPMPGLYAGQLLFASGAAVCGLAPSFTVLLVGRAVTGLGAGLVVVVLYVVIGRVFPAVIRPRVFAWVSAAWVLPSLVGAPLSAWLTTAFTWRLVFWIVVPPTILTFAAIVRQRARIEAGSPADESATTTDDQRRAHRRTAVMGVLVALAAGLVQLGAHERVSVLSWQALAAVAGVVGLLVVTPRLVPAGTLRMAVGIPSVIVSRFLLNAAFNGAITFVPLMFTQERGANLSVAGVVLAVGSFGWSAGSWVQGRPAFGGRRAVLVSLGGLFLAVGILLMVAITATGLSVWFFAPAMVLAGLGMGFGSTSLSVLLLDLAPVSDYSAASAALQLSDVLGSVIGIAGASAIFAALHTQGGDQHTYIVIWAVLSAVAGLVVVSGRRCVAP